MEHTSNAKILIADENAAQRTQLRESLTRAGYRNVEEAVNGDDALHKSTVCTRTLPSLTSGCPNWTV